MSDLECSVQPVMEKLIDGVGITLSLEAASDVAAWTLKVAMVFDAARANQARFYRADEGANLKFLRHPPGGCLIWAGKIDGKLPLLMINGRHVFRHLPEGELEREGLATTLGFGHLVLQVLSTRTGSGDSEVFPERALEIPNRSLLELWPGRDTLLRWPPANEFGHTEQDLDELASRFTQHAGS